MIFTTRDIETYELQSSQNLTTQKNYIWFYRSLCIGIIAENNHFIIFKNNEPVLYTEDREISYVFVMKGKSGNKKVWYCLLVQKNQMSDFMHNTIIINDTAKTTNPLGITMNIHNLKQYGEIMCCGKGSISRLNLKKELEDQCKFSDNPLLNSIVFEHKTTCWNNLIRNIREIISIKEKSYSQIK